MCPLLTHLSWLPITLRRSPGSITLSPTTPSSRNAALFSATSRPLHMLFPYPEHPLWPLTWLILIPPSVRTYRSLVLAREGSL